MTIRFYVHTPKGQAVDTALIDSGATENFMNLKYAQNLQLPMQEMEDPQVVFNIDGTANKSGEIKYYTDLSIQTGQDFTLFRFFLTNTGTSKVILGYPWMCAIQPRIDWKRGWIDSEHLPIVFRIPGQRHVPFIQQNKYGDMQAADNSELSGLPQSYRHLLEEGDKLMIARLAVEAKDDPAEKNSSSISTICQSLQRRGIA